MKTIIFYLFFYLNPQLSVPPANWYLYQTSEISIEFAQKPEIRNLTLPSEIGDIESKILAYAGTGLDTNRIYLLSSNIFPGEYIHSSNTEILDDLYNSIVEGALGDENYVISSRKSIMMNGYSGREIKAEMKDGKSKSQFLLILVENRGYICQTITKEGNNDPESERRFHQSFKLKK